jgi:hypothetical protein
MTADRVIVFFDGGGDSAQDKANEWFRENKYIQVISIVPSFAGADTEYKYSILIHYRED